MTFPPFPYVPYFLVTCIVKLMFFNEAPTGSTYNHSYFLYFNYFLVVSTLLLTKASTQPPPLRSLWSLHHIIEINHNDNKFPLWYRVAYISFMISYIVFFSLVCYFNDFLGPYYPTFKLFLSTICWWIGPEPPSFYMLLFSLR